jgi:osmotically-inducible protein OsmY
LCQTSLLATSLAVANDIEVRLAASGTPTDAALTDVILSALEWSGLIPTNMLEATVCEGWVTLKGEVEWEYQRQEAERVVCRLSGVTGVTNVITVKPSAPASALKEEIDEALSRNTHIDIDRISVVVVDDSAVILTGTVGSWAEREEVERAVWVGTRHDFGGQSYRRFLMRLASLLCALFRHFQAFCEYGTSCGRTVS